MHILEFVQLLNNWLFDYYLYHNQTQIELEAAAFRGLIKHLQKRIDAQNIDIMNLAGFCRNCLSKWYKAEADARGVSITDDEAREAIYGMPYSVWKEKHQEAASEEQMRKFEETKPLHAKISGHNWGFEYYKS